MKAILVGFWRVSVESKGLRYELSRLNTCADRAPNYICAHFHQTKQRKMIKKFAMLATMAAFFVACSSSTQENMENKADEAANAAQETLDKAAAEAEAAAAAAATATEAAVDTAAAAVETAVDAAKETVAH